MHIPGMDKDSPFQQEKEMTLTSRFRKALFAFLITNADGDDFAKGIFTIRAEVTRGGHMKVYSMKFKRPRTDFGWAVLMLRVRAFHIYIQVRQWS